MKPTGATKETTNPIDLLLDAFKYAEDIDRSVAARLRIIELINERERLRRLLRAVTSPTKCYCDAIAGTTCWHCEAREILNDATPSTSAGGG